MSQKTRRDCASLSYHHASYASDCSSGSEDHGQKKQPTQKRQLQSHAVFSADHQRHSPAVSSDNNQKRVTDDHSTSNIVSNKKHRYGDASSIDDQRGLSGVSRDNRKQQTYAVAASRDDDRKRPAGVDYETKERVACGWAAKDNRVTGREPIRTVLFDTGRHNNNGDDDDNIVDISHGNHVTKAGQSFLFDTVVIREVVFLKVKFAKFDVDLKFSNLPNSICRTILLTMTLNIGGNSAESMFMIK